MKNNHLPLSQSHFINGNEACAEAALLAGCRFFAGYPITPSTEIAEHLAERLPEVGGIFIQMEDEIASMNAVLGAVWGGLKGMSATSGPGFSLMMENIGLAVMTETPCVVVDVQRGGPSTGLATLVGQGDMMQARWGSHGSYEIIALCPSSPQEFFYQTIQAFNLSEKFRVPVLLMADEMVGHMSEKVVIPPIEKLEIYPRRYTLKPPGEYKVYQRAENGVPEMVKAGDGYRIHVTGTTHDERGYPFMNEETQKELIPRLVDKIRKNHKELIDTKEFFTEDAEVVLVGYGITARTLRWVAHLAREKNLKVGVLKLNIVWPFPDEVVLNLAKKVKALVVCEINMGQMVREVERAAKGFCEVKFMGHPGGGMHSPTDILEAVQQVKA
ncbi:MAG: 2-oxoglutarate ferredoxin oxidoreductase subunit alpha [candidate division Zixibacteria bacterium RBG-1]|nr:MAG: 2-oxoglutarate ferredoxin oxidoreductase subunit alpha [candidate division Zixibacteria bacterium RBG-1]OGC83812.1 MAG: 2-oxoglutarate synthase subunit alpha [candidate division Zixibacteria bacterium RBG_19FT_COMBO_42_43]